MTEPCWGTLYGIGAGPGDPELMTLKGLRILQSAPIIAFPEGVRGQVGFAQSIVSKWLQPHQRQLPLHFPYVQDDVALNQAWQTASETVWQYLSVGQDVAFLSEGDVSFYSTFSYLAQMLLHHHPEVVVQTIPGVSSPMAAAAALGIPLVTRANRLIVLPALYTVSDLETALNTADVVVLMKVGSVYSEVWSVLKGYGLLSRSFVVERATLPTQKIYRDLSDRPTLELHYFSLLIVQVTQAG